MKAKFFSGKIPAFSMKLKKIDYSVITKLNIQW